MATWIPDIIPEGCQAHDDCCERCAKMCLEGEADRQCKTSCDLDLAVEYPYYGIATYLAGRDTYMKLKEKYCSCEDK